MTIIHWIVGAIFLLLFLILTLLSIREKNLKTMVAMIFSSFLLTVSATVISMIVLDKYTKKVKILTYTTQKDLAHESVIVRGVLQNVGKYEVGYCTLEIRVSNNPRGRRASSYFTPTKSLDFMGDVGNKVSSVTVEEDVAENLAPGEKKKFFTSVRYPTYFENPKYTLKLHCQ
jgi:hypothetical protein